MKQSNHLNIALFDSLIKDTVTVLKYIFFNPYCFYVNAKAITCCPLFRTPKDLLVL